MSITKEEKLRIQTEYATKEGDTGSPQVQIAVLTSEILAITEHLKLHPKDYSGRRGLLGMVSRRRRLLDYLKRTTPKQYVQMITRLNIRK
jgi:small subunit ribosomal protein S15